MTPKNDGAKRPLRFRTIWINTAVLLLSIVLALGIAELLARQFFDIASSPPLYVGEFENEESENFVVDEHTGWRMRSAHSFAWRIGDGAQAHTYKSNADGFRSMKEFSEQGSIALVGDSFTFGTGIAYEQSFGAVLESRLGSSPVYNFAMPGFGIDQMWMALKHQASRIEPQLVVVAFVDADFERSLSAYRKFEGFNKPSYVLDQGTLRLRTREDQPPAIVIWMRRNLALANALSKNLEQLGHHLPLGSWWTINAEILQQMALDAREEGVPILFVRLPSKGQREFATLSSHMSSMGANFLDLGEKTRDDAGQEIFIPGDGHINEQGHRLVADAIFSWISANQSELIAE
jgi:hypothetical protein